MQNYTQMFSYDELGNLQTMQSQGRWSRSYIYDNLTNRLLRHEGTNNVYTYDAHGNMISMPHLSSMTWNSSDMLRSATNGTFTSYYSYNAAGDRVRKGVDNGITLSTATNSIRYQYDNHLGSASLELDRTAAIISYEEYHPFGTTSYRSGRTETEVSQKYSQYTPYQYAGNKPVSYIDLDGLEEAIFYDSFNHLINNINGINDTEYNEHLTFFGLSKELRESDSSLNELFNRYEPLLLKGYSLQDKDVPFNSPAGKILEEINFIYMVKYENTLPAVEIIDKK